MQAAHPVLQPVIRSNVFDGFGAFLAEQHIAMGLPDLLAEVGLDRRMALQQPNSPAEDIPLNPVSHLFERVAQRAGRPCLGLEFAEAYPIGAFGFLLSHAPSIRDAIANLLRFVPTFTHPVHITFTEGDGGTGYIEWMFPLEFTHAMPQFVSFTLGAVIVRLRQIAGADWVPLRVELIHSPLACRDIYTRLLGPNVRFDAPKNRLWFDPTTLAKRRTATPLQSSTGGPPVNIERLYATMISTTSRELEASRRAHSVEQDIRARLRDHLVAVLPQGAPDLEHTAGALQTTGRQLQYALEQAGTSFSDELNDTRRMTAERLLVSTDQSMSDIAVALGFSELSSFTRAARESWFGMSPSKFRARMRSERDNPVKPQNS